MLNEEIFNPVPIPEEAYNDGTYTNYLLGDYSVPAVQVYYEGNWVTLPMHKDFRKDITSTMVNAGRNASAEVIGEVIGGRTQSKVSGLVFPYLYAHEWKKILTIFKGENISRPVKYFDQEAGDFIVRQMYINDREAEIFAYRQDGSGRVEIYQNCSMNLIDMGKSE